MKQIRRQEVLVIESFDLLHDVVSSSQFTSAPQPTYQDLTPPQSLRNPLDLTQFSANDNAAHELDINPAYSAQLVPPVNGDDPFAAPVIDSTTSGLMDLDPQPPAFDDSAQMTPAESQAAFIGGYIPAVVETPVPAAPAVVDPLVAWRAANAAALKKKDEDEAAAKKAAAEKAKAFLAKSEADRKKAIDARKANNRAAQKASPDAGVPDGKTWEKVYKLTDFSHDKARTKDLGRFKTVLNHAKELDVKIAVKA